MARNRGSRIKDDETDETLRRQGDAREKAARIANARAGDTQEPGRAGGRPGSHEDWTHDARCQRARAIGIEGRPGMTGDDLVDALRRH